MEKVKNKVEEEKTDKFLDDLNIMNANRIVMLPNSILFAPPVVEKQTKAGIWKLDETLSKDEQEGLPHRWHRVLVVGVNTFDIAVGDEFWFSPSLDHPRRVNINGVAYWHIGIHALLAIRKAAVVQTKGGL